ncbi:MAG: hypothetical protein Q8Q08_08605 [Candidatus Omnitrophota bacterium]|nr:hypothetical protein [Candidatus Omnitrophota bacterium]MDZ4241757.1 hypothetical protein [Candidatus Omnitrophota bacterium]
MVDYDPKVIQEYAERLTKQSRSIVAMQFFIGLLSGMIIAGGITALLDVGYDFLLIAVGTLVGAVLGIFSGQNRAFDMNLKAHTALLLSRIEKNSRG